MRNSLFRNAILAAAVAAALPAAGCLIGERWHSLYLDPDGALTWTAVERHIRSDADAPADREREEADYLAQARASNHPIARGLRRLEPTSLETRIVRDARPFGVVCEGRFGSAQAALQRLLDGLGLPGKVELVRHDGVTRLTVTIDTAKIDPDAETDEDLAALVGDHENTRILLTRGRFIEASGFELSKDGAVATPLEQKIDETTVEPLVYSLSWEE